MMLPPRDRVRGPTLPPTDMPEATPRKILVCHRDAARRAELQSALESLGHAVVAAVGKRWDVVELARKHRPEVILSSLRLEDGDSIDALVEVSREDPVPSVIVTTRTDLEAVERALDDHVMAYLVEPVTAADLQPTIVLVLSRFEEFQALRREVDTLKSAMEARKVIEKAKGQLMKAKQLPEADAYRLMQKLASEKRRKLVEIAEAILLTGGL